VAAALRKFHDGAPIPGRFDALSVVDDYQPRPRRMASPFPTSSMTREPSASGFALLEVLRPLSLSQRPAQCELSRRRRAQDRRLGVRRDGDRFFDLANFSVNHEFEVEDDPGCCVPISGRSASATWPRSG